MKNTKNEDFLLSLTFNDKDLIKSKINLKNEFFFDCIGGDRDGVPEIISNNLYSFDCAGAPPTE